MGMSTGFRGLFASAAIASASASADAPAGAPNVEAASAVPAIRLSESREHYRIHAPDLDSVVAQIQGREPRPGDDGTSIARTRANLTVAYRLYPAEPACRVTDLAVSLDVTVRLPHWEPAKAMRPVLREQWERMKIGIEIHERGHRDIAVEAAESLNHRLHALVPEPGTDCAALERRILRERIKAQMRHENRDAAYDRRTRHGVTQAPKPPEPDQGTDRPGPRDFRDRGEGRDLPGRARY